MSSSSTARTSYTQQIASTWKSQYKENRPFGTTTPSVGVKEHDPGEQRERPSIPELLKEIIRCGTLAPSSHNTQCWKFQIDDENDDDYFCCNTNGDGSTTTKIKVLPDYERRCPVVDPDDHHLFVTLGCAVENIVVAAQHYGFMVKRIDNHNPKDDGIVVHLTHPSTSQANLNSDDDDDDKNENNKKKMANEILYEAIFQRQCTRTEYDGKPLSDEEIETIQSALGNQYDGVFMKLVTDTETKQLVLNYIIQANTNQVTDPAFKEELKSWVRFGEYEATTHQDGLYGKCMGNPSVPRWIGGHVFDYVLKPEPENQKITKQVQSSAGFAIFVSQKDDPKHWVDAGRCYERFALVTTALGIKNAFLNQPVEDGTIRPQFAHALGLVDDENPTSSSSTTTTTTTTTNRRQCRPDLIVRFGKGNEMPRSLRRPVDSVLVPRTTSKSS